MKNENGLSSGILDILLFCTGFHVVVNWFKIHFLSLRHIKACHSLTDIKEHININTFSLVHVIKI